MILEQFVLEQHTYICLLLTGLVKFKEIMLFSLCQNQNPIL